MVKLFGYTIAKETRVLTAEHARGSHQTSEASDQGQVNAGIYTPKLPHPTKMLKYDGICNDPETRIGIDLLTDMIAGVGYYTQMPERDADGKEVNTEDPKKATVDRWLDQVKFQDKYKQIVRAKLSKGFCPIEHLPGGNIKLLPPESFYIWRNKRGRIFRYSQEINGSPVAYWQVSNWQESLKTEDERKDTEIVDESLVAGTLDDTTLFIHNEDTSHPYGHSLIDSIADLVEARKQMNIDIPKIIHRYSSPLGIHEADGDIASLKTAITDREVDEDVYVGNVRKDELRHTYLEPTGQAKFLPYVELVYYQIAEALHAPLILLMKNATEASATKMLESIDRYVQGEQSQNAELIEHEFFMRLLKMSEPTPDFLHGAPKAVLDEMTLDQIGTLKGNSTITWEQAQDLIRQKGIPIIEVEKPEPVLQSPMFDEKPMVDQTKMHTLETNLRVIHESVQEHTMTVIEAIREGDRVISSQVARWRQETVRKLSIALNKSVMSLSPETEMYFRFLHNELFDQFRNRLLPTGVKSTDEPASYTVIPNS